MKRLLIITWVAALGCAALAADRDPVYSFTYQAALRDEVGNVISNGGAVVRNHELVVRLWDNATGGNLLWGRHFTVFTDETGLFNLEVHDNGGALVADDGNPSYTTLENALSANAAGSVYIGIKVVGSDNEISPRQKMFAVPYAGVANEARKLRGDVTVDGTLTVTVADKTSEVKITSDGISQSSGSSVFNNLQVNDSVDASSLEVKNNSVFTGAATFGGSVAVGSKNAPVASFTVASKDFGVDGNGNTTVGGTLTVDGDATVEGKLKAGSLEVNNAALVPVPVGGIIMWTKAESPDGQGWATSKNGGYWAVCNGKNGDGGTKINGITIPDLRGRFIVGASPSNDPNDRGDGLSHYDLGANTAGVERVSLLEAQIPAHKHLYVAEALLNDRLGENSEWGSNDLRYKIGKIHTTNIGPHPRFGYQWNSGNDQMSIVETGITGGDGTKSGNYLAEGHAAEHENRPPYYALIYIIRVR